MRVPLGNGAYVNVAHISLLSAVEKARNHPDAFELKFVLCGQHEHRHIGDESSVRALHDRLVKALDQIGP